MNLVMEIRDQGADRFVMAVFRDQLPFATSRALNETAKDFQRGQRKRMHSIFNIKDPGFSDRAVKIKPFASKESLEARISIDPPPARKDPADRSDIFAKFETEDTKTPHDGRSIAVPTEHVPRTASGRVRADWKPRRVLERNFKDGFRAFVRPSRKRPGVRTIFFVEPGNKIVPLYQLVPHVSLPPDLEFVSTARGVVDDRWRVNFLEAFDRAIRKAR